MNCIPILKSDKYVFLTPSQNMNSTIEITISDVEGDIMGKYSKKLQTYIKLIPDLRFDVFVKSVRVKRMTNHKLTRQGYEIPEVDNFVIIKDEKDSNI